VLLGGRVLISTCETGVSSMASRTAPFITVICAPGFVELSLLQLLRKTKIKQQKNKRTNDLIDMALV
jgi:hypothetical protein